MYLKDDNVVFMCMNGIRECITKARGYTPYGCTACPLELPSPYHFDEYLKMNGSPLTPKSNANSAVSAPEHASEEPKKKSRNSYSRFVEKYFIFHFKINFRIQKLIYIYETFYSYTFRNIIEQLI